MPKPKNYKSFIKGKKKKLNVGIFALDRKESVRFPQEIGIYGKNKPLNLVQKRKALGFLKTVVVMEFLQTTQWELGEKIHIRNRNLDVIHYYLMGIRKEHAIYNIHFLVLNLRILLSNLSTRMLYKKKCLINYVQNEHIKKTLMVKPIEEFPKRELMVTWNKWLGGVLTNFKTIAKRILARLRTKDKNQENFKYSVTYGKNIPKIPHFVISTGECHWAINESNLIRVKSLQLVNTTHLGSFNEMTMGMNTSYYALRSFTALVQECASSMRQTAKLFHRRKLLRRLGRKAKSISATKKVIWFRDHGNKHKINNIADITEKASREFNENAYNDVPTTEASKEFTKNDVPVSNWNEYDTGESGTSTSDGIFNDITLQQPNFIEKKEDDANKRLLNAVLKWLSTGVSNETEELKQKKNKIKKSDSGFNLEDALIKSLKQKKKKNKKKATVALI